MTDQPDLARSFGAVAAAYDRGRPDYPAAAVEWLVGRDAATIVELGAGTGKLTRSLVAAGHDVHATDPDAPLADRMAAEAAMAMVDVVRSGELDRLRICEAEDCDGVIVDLSKNRSRRYCDRGCGNRMAVQAYRERKRS